MDDEVFDGAVCWKFFANSLKNYSVLKEDQ